MIDRESRESHSHNLHCDVSSYSVIHCLHIGVYCSNVVYVFKMCPWPLSRSVTTLIWFIPMLILAQLVYYLGCFIDIFNCLGPSYFFMFFPPIFVGSFTDCPGIPTAGVGPIKGIFSSLLKVQLVHYHTYFSVQASKPALLFFFVKDSKYNSHSRIDFEFT